MEDFIQEYVNVMKASAIEMIRNGADGMDVAKQIAEKHGKAVARLIFMSIALDNGRKEEVKKYFDSFV